MEISGRSELWARQTSPSLRCFLLCGIRIFQHENRRLRRIGGQKGKIAPQIKQWSQPPAYEIWKLVSSWEVQSTHSESLNQFSQKWRTNGGSVAEPNLTNARNSRCCYLKDMSCFVDVRLEPSSSQPKGQGTNRLPSPDALAMLWRITGSRAASAPVPCHSGLGEGFEQFLKSLIFQMWSKFGFTRMVLPTLESVLPQVDQKELVQSCTLPSRSCPLPSTNKYATSCKSVLTIQELCEFLPHGPWQRPLTSNQSLTCCLFIDVFRW